MQWTLEMPTWKQRQKNLFFVAGSEFGELAGHTLVINKALYGLKSSGLRYHEKFADTLCDMGYVPSKINDTWMKQNGDVWEYIAVCVDNLAIAAKDAGVVIKMLREKYGYKIKGDGPIDYHLRATVSRDKDVHSFTPRLVTLKRFLIPTTASMGSYPRTKMLLWNMEIIPNFT